MASNIRQNGKFVVPGEKLCVIEEFSPSDGTFEEEGNVYSKIVGTTTFDLSNRTAAVQQKSRRPVVPEENAIVVATVTRSQKKMAQLEIFSIQNEQVTLPFTGVLHISSSSPTYQPSMKDVTKTGDIIRAKIINVKSVMPQVTTIGRNLGVIRALCSQCGQKLVANDRNLRCAVCGNIERRKTAEDYDRDIA